MNCNTTHYRANSSSVPGDPTANAEAFETLHEASLALGAGLLGERLFAELEDPALFETGARRLFPDFPEGRERWLDRGNLIRLGMRWWRKTAGLEEEGEAPEPREVWTAERVERRLRRTLAYGALHLWRARWLLRLSESSLAWRTGRQGPWRLIVVENGSLAHRDWIRGKPLPIPSGWKKTKLERAASFDVATLDRLRVFATELRKVVADGGEIRGRLSPNREFRRCGPGTRMG